MYLNFYHLKKEPFNITPDPELLFLSPSHKEALAAVVYGVRQRKGFIAIIGEVGVGKTTILRSFLDRVDREKLKTIYLFNANLSFRALLRTIYHGLGKAPASEEPFEMVDHLHRLLINEYRAGNNVVLVIDEAQNMPVETLENLRMLSNLETATDKLIQIVFSGQPEFEEKLNGATLRQLKQRIVITARILPLTLKESLAYIEHRIAKTAAESCEIFSGGALQEIVKRAAGIPRVINILCDNCLINSFGNQQPKVSAKVAKGTIADLDGSGTGWSERKLWLTAAAALSACLLVWTLNWVRIRAGEKTGQAQQVQAAAALVREEAAAVAPQQAAAPAEQEPPPLQQAAAPAAPSAPPAPAARQPEPPRPADIEGESLRKVVRKGDTLARLIVENYGSVDNRLIKRVLRDNPQIVNKDYIVEGDKIYFPPGR